MAPSAPQTPNSPFPSPNTVQPSSLSRLTLSDKLLLSQAVHHIGTSPPDWGRVSSILLPHPLIKTKSRLEQAAKAGITLGRVFGSRECERAWVALMRQYNLVLQPGERDPALDNEGESGSPAVGNRAKEARGLPPKTDRGSQLALAQFLYAERVRELQDQIRAKEKAFKTLAGEIEALNSGTLDDKLLLELEKSGMLREESEKEKEEKEIAALRRDDDTDDLTPSASQSSTGRAEQSTPKKTSSTKTSPKVSREQKSNSTASSANRSPLAEKDKVEKAKGASPAKQSAETKTSSISPKAALKEKKDENKAATTSANVASKQNEASGTKGDAAASSNDGDRKTDAAPVPSQQNKNNIPIVDVTEATSNQTQKDATKSASVTSSEAAEANAKRKRDQTSPEKEAGKSDSTQKKARMSSGTSDAVANAEETAANIPNVALSDPQTLLAAQEKDSKKDVPPAKGNAAAPGKITEVSSLEKEEELEKPPVEAEKRSKAPLDTGKADASADAMEGIEEDEERDDDDDDGQEAEKRPEPRRSRRSGRNVSVTTDEVPTPPPSASATTTSTAKNNRIEALRSREASGASPDTDDERMEEDTVDGEASRSTIDRSRTSVSPSAVRRGRGASRQSRRSGGRAPSTGTTGVGGDEAGSDVEREKAAQVMEKRRMEKVLMMLLNEVSNHTHGNLFHAPIKESDAPDYYTLIRHPLDLKTIKARIKEGRITSATQLRRSLMQMFANSLIYNRPGSEIHRMALEMRDAAEDMLDRFEQTQMSAKASRR